MIKWDLPFKMQLLVVTLANGSRILRIRPWGPEVVVVGDVILHER